MAALTFPTTREAAASDSRDGLVSRFSNDTLETVNEYHILPLGFNPA